MFKKSQYVVYLFLFLSIVFNAQETITVEGLIVDKDKYAIPLRCS